MSPVVVMGLLVRGPSQEQMSREVGQAVGGVTSVSGPVVAGVLVPDTDAENTV